MIERHRPADIVDRIADHLIGDHVELMRENARLRELNAEWEKKAASWLASPEATQQLDGYRELAQRLNAVEAEAGKWKAEYARLAGDYSEEAAALRKRAEQAEAEVSRLVRVADALRNSTEEYESADGMGRFALLDCWHEFDEAVDAARGGQ